MRKATLGLAVAAAVAGVAGLAQATATAGSPHWHIVTLPVSGSSFSYAEPGIVAGPNGKTMIVVTATANTGAPPTYWITRNGGKTWGAGRDLDSTGSATGDADALVGPDGYLYALDLGYNPNPHKPPNTRVIVFRSRTGQTFSGPAVFPTHGLTEPDRPWLAVNPHNPANVDVVYANAGSALYLWRSMDHGAKFGAPIAVSGGSPGHPAVALSSRPLFDPTKTGRLFMLYETTGSAKLGIPHGHVYEVPLTQLWLATSTDAGQTWSRRRVLDTSKLTGPLKGAIIGHALVSSAIDRHGDLYVAFSARPKSATETTVYLTHSTTHGQTWAAPVPIKAATASNVMPALAVNPHGAAYLSWYGSTNHDFRSPTAAWREMFASSADPLSSHPHFAVSQVSGSQPVHVGGINAAGAFGSDTGANWGLRDFQGIAVGPCGAPVLAWADDNGVKATEFATPVSACH